MYNLTLQARKRASHVIFKNPQSIYSFTALQLFTQPTIKLYVKEQWQNKKHETEQKSERERTSDGEENAQNP